MNSLFYVLIFVLPSVLIGVGVGFYLGRGTHVGEDRLIAQREREATLKAVMTLLSSAEQLTSDVDRHNTEIQEVGRDIEGMQMTGELEHVQQVLLKQISEVIQSNQRLEEDLTYTRHRMEQQAQEIDETRREARTDALSGVANRKDFDEQLHYMLTVFKREQTSFVIVLADVDHFKWINDTHGHQAGDRVVSHVGELFKQCLRPGDYVARYGGDEFGLLFPNTDLQNGVELAEKIRVALNRSNFNVGLNGERVAATFSMGVAAVQSGDSSEALFERADKALYMSKNGGRNQVNVFRPEPDLVTA